jgi:serine kinase of HPr protein (carbohydrate metabolism regulator)
MNGIVRQAGCVAIEGRALLIDGPPGSGKSSLALALIDRGARLIGDDGVTLAAREGRLWASPPPNTAGLIEIRNVGIVPLPTSAAPVALAITLDQAAPRFIDSAEMRNICGIPLPWIRLHPNSPVLALRAEWAMTIHGLD